MPATQLTLRLRVLKQPSRKSFSEATLLKELKTRSKELQSGQVRGLSTQAVYGFSL